MSMLYEKHDYLNKNINFIISTEIYEYDMTSAGFNIIKQYKLLDEKTINMLSVLPKKEQTIKIGKLQKSIKGFGKVLSQHFKEARKLFFDANDIKDNDVLAIKKDAIFTFKKCDNVKFGFIEYKLKNIYTSYYYINRNEFYYNREKVDIKGVNDTMAELHREYMLKVMHRFFFMNENSDKKATIKFLKDFAQFYKSKELHVGYYRELSANSLYRLKDFGYTNNLFGIETDVDIKHVDINYNYINYIIPLINIHL